MNNDAGAFLLLRPTLLLLLLLLRFRLPRSSSTSALNSAVLLLLGLSTFSHLSSIRINGSMDADRGGDGSGDDGVQY